MTIKQQILKEWNKLKTVRQSYSEIAKKVGCNKTYVFKVVKQANSSPRANSEA